MFDRQVDKGLQDVLEHHIQTLIIKLTNDSYAHRNKNNTIEGEVKYHSFDHVTSNSISQAVGVYLHHTGVKTLSSEQVNKKTLELTLYLWMYHKYDTFTYQAYVRKAKNRETKEKRNRILTMM